MGLASPLPQTIGISEGTSSFAVFNVLTKFRRGEEKDSSTYEDKS